MLDSQGGCLFEMAFFYLMNNYVIRFISVESPNDVYTKLNLDNKQSTNLTRKNYLNFLASFCVRKSISATYTPHFFFDFPDFNL